MDGQNQGKDAIDLSLEIIGKAHSDLLECYRHIIMIHKNCDDLKIHNRILIADGFGYSVNFFNLFYIATLQSLKKIKKVAFPKYDDNFSAEDNRLLFCEYYDFASDLFFCLYGLLIFISKHLRSNSFVVGQIKDAINEVKKIITQCILTISEYEKRSFINFAFFEFGIGSGEDFDVIHTPLTFDDPWYNARLQEYKNFVLTGECAEEYYPFELWLYNKQNHRSDRRKNHLDISELETYCAYVSNEEYLFKNINDYIIAYFFDFMRKSNRTQAEFAQLNSEKHGAFRHLKYEEKRSAFYSTIESVNEIINITVICAAINYPIYLSKDRSRIVDTDYNKGKRNKLMSFISLVKAAYGIEKNVNPVALGKVFRNVFSFDKTLFQKWPCISFLLYWTSHFFEYKKYCKLFLEEANTPKAETKQINISPSASVVVATWKNTDFQEVIQKKYIEREALLRLQKMFFFALFDFVKDIDQKTTFPPNDSFYTLRIKDLLYEALYDGSWKSTKKQTVIFNEILSKSLPKSSVTIDFEKFQKTAFHPTETALFLIHSINSYAREPRYTTLTQIINFIDEQRVKTFGYYSMDFKELESLAKKGGKKLLKETELMENIDNGFSISLAQKSPTFENQFFSRTVTCKVFPETDTKLLQLECGKIIFSYDNYYRQLYSNFTSSVYLNEERNMATHYSKFKFTEGLLKKDYCIDLLLLLFDLKSKNTNEQEIRLNLEKLSSFIDCLNRINFINIVRNKVSFSNQYYILGRVMLMIKTSNSDKSISLAERMYWKEQMYNMDTETPLDEIVKLFYEMDVNSKVKREGPPPYTVYQVPLNDVPDEWKSFYAKNTPSLSKEFLTELSAVLTTISKLLKDIESNDEELQNKIAEALEVLNKDDFSLEEYFAFADSLSDIYYSSSRKLNIKYDCNIDTDSLSWVRLCDKYFSRLKDHIVQSKVLDKFSENISKEINNPQILEEVINKTNELRKGNKEIINDQGELLIDRPILKKIGKCIENYPFEEELRNFLNTMFGVANICRVKKGTEPNAVNVETVVDDDVNFFDLYGYESKLYLIKVLIQMAEIDLTNK